MKRMAQIIKVKPEVIAEYKRIHAAVWPEILQGDFRSEYQKLHDLPEGAGKHPLRLLGISRQRFQGRHGKDQKAPRMREWWDITDPMQIPSKPASPANGGR